MLERNERGRRPRARWQAPAPRSDPGTAPQCRAGRVDTPASKHWGQQPAPARSPRGRGTPGPGQGTGRMAHGAAGGDAGGPVATRSYKGDGGKPGGLATLWTFVLAPRPKKSPSRIPRLPWLAPAGLCAWHKPRPPLPCPLARRCLGARLPLWRAGGVLRGKVPAGLRGLTGGSSGALPSEEVWTAPAAR